MVANRNDLEKGVKIIALANAICDRPNAVARLIQYLPSVVRKGTYCRVSLRCGALTNQGKNKEPVKDISENKTSAKEPFLEMAPTMSFDVLSS